MLEFLKVEQPDQIKKLLKEFNPQKQTWIVSDLKSKKEIQNESIIRIGYYTDDSILRVSDFWRLWLRRLQPTIQIVSSDFIKILVQNYMDLFAEKIGLSDYQASTLEKYVQEFASIVLHPESDSVLKEWISTQTEYKKWAEWYLLARNCIQYIVKEKKVIDAKWSAAYLQTLDATKLNWPYELIVDLGTELTSVEMGLFKIFSQKQNVQVIVPQPEWHKRFPYLLKTYQENFGYGKSKSLASEIVVTHQLNKQFVRLSTQLSEVKFVVSQVRKWLDQGVALSQIAVIAADIEDYWPALEVFFNTEGIPLQKDIVTSLNSLGDIQVFLSHIKSLTEEVSLESLEKTFYQSTQMPTVKFEKFKSLFYQLFDEENLKRDEKVKDLFYKKIDFQKEINRDDFMVQLIKIWVTIPEKENSAYLFEIIFKDFLSQSLNVEMKLNRWYQFFKSRISRKEVKITNAAEDGVQVLSLMSAQMSQADHQIFIGLTEEAFRNPKKTMLPLKDIELLKNQFDLAVDYPDESHLDFNLRWQSEKLCLSSIYTAPHLSFSSEPLTTSLYFLENCPVSEISQPGLTRLDEVLKNRLHFDFSKLPNESQNYKRLQADLTGAPVVVKSEAFKNISASDVENYAKCHFKLLASKGYRLRDYPMVSIDIDPRQKGTIVHALFEFIIQQMHSNLFKIENVEIFLDDKRAEIQLYQNEDSFWLIQKTKLLALSSKFYEFEKNRKNILETLTELDFEIFFDFEKQNFSKNKSENENALAIKGRIDRVDKIKSADQVSYILYDYKSSAQQASNYTKWMGEYEFQMLIYIFALESILVESTSVKGALYYLFKNFDLTKGFVDSQLAVDHLQFSSRVKSLATIEIKDQLKQQFIDFMTIVFTDLANGSFNTQPYKNTICSDCDWRKLCRAQHLM